MEWVLVTRASFLFLPHNKMKNFKQTKKGFTLIELMLYVSLFAVMIFTISAFFSTQLVANTKNQTILEVETQGRISMEYILSAIRNSGDVNSPTLGNTASVLSLNVYDASKDPTVFDVSLGSLRVTEGVNSPISLTNEKVTVSGLNFYNLSKASTPGALQVEFTISYINTSGRNEYEFEKTFIGGATLRQP